MVDLCPVAKWSVFKWWSENRTEKSLFMVQNVQYSTGPPSHVTLTFEYWPPILSGIQIVNLLFESRTSSQLQSQKKTDLDPF